MKSGIYNRFKDLHILCSLLCLIELIFLPSIFDPILFFCHWYEPKSFLHIIFRNYVYWLGGKINILKEKKNWSVCLLAIMWWFRIIRFLLRELNFKLIFLSASEAVMCFFLKYRNQFLLRLTYTWREILCISEDLLIKELKTLRTH